MFNIEHQVGIIAKGWRKSRSNRRGASVPGFSSFNSVFSVRGQTVRGHRNVIDPGNSYPYPEKVNAYADATKSSDARVHGVNADFTISSEISVDGSTIQKKNMSLNPDGSFGNGSTYRHAGMSEHFFMTQGDQTIQFRLTGRWTYTKGLAGSFIPSGVEPVINEYTIPNIPFAW